MASKMILWRQKLLDIVKRNKLLNFRETKRTTLQITYPEPENLFSAILSGKVLEFPVGEQDTLLFEDFEPRKSKNTIRAS